MVAASFHWLQRHIDINALQRVAKQYASQVYVLAIPGTFVDTSREIAVMEGGDDRAETAIRDAFTIESERSFDQDPRLDVIVLLAAYNDAGTVIGVIGRFVWVLSIWGDSAKEDEARFPDVFVPPMLLEEVFDDFFMPLGHDGAHLVEV